MTFYHFAQIGTSRASCATGLRKSENRRVQHGRIPREYIKAYERSL